MREEGVGGEARLRPRARREASGGPVRLVAKCTTGHRFSTGLRAGASPPPSQEGGAGRWLLPAVASGAQSAAAAAVVAHRRLEVAAGGVDRAFAGDRAVALAVRAVAAAPVVLIVRWESAWPGVRAPLRTGPAGTVDPPPAVGDEQPALGDAPLLVFGALPRGPARGDFGVPVAAGLRCRHRPAACCWVGSAARGDRWPLGVARTASQSMRRLRAIRSRSAWR